MGGACGTYGVEVSFIQGFGGETQRKMDHLEDLHIDGRVISK
jgi:hypothetical protein